MKKGKTFANIVDAILEYASSFQVTDDNRIDREIIADKVNDVRINLLHDEYVSSRYIGDEYYSLVKCIRIGKKDMTCDEEDKCANLDLSVWIGEIPALVERVGWDNIKYVGTVNFTKKASRVSMSKFLSHGASTYSYDKPIFTMITNGRLMFKNVDCLEVVNALALIKTPVPYCDIDTNTDPYPVPDAFKLELIVKQDLGYALGIPADELNDTRHSPTQQQQPKKDE